MSKPSLDVGVIGMGHVGPAIASAMRASGATIVGVSARSEEAKDRTEAMLPGVEIMDPEEVARRAQVLFLAVPDAQIEKVTQQLVGADVIRPGTVLAHLSGALGIKPLESAAKKGAITLALHPVMTFSGTSLDVLRLLGCPTAYTCSPIAEPVALALIDQLGGDAFALAEEDRGLYHAGLAHAANYLVTLVAQGAQVLGAAGIDEPEHVLTPLIKAAVSRVLEEGMSGLTGPVSRGDMATVDAHLDALDSVPELAAVGRAYRAMAQATKAALHGDEGGPLVVHSRADLQAALAADPRPTGLVMTMGALHEGHLELVRSIKTPSNKVVVSIFVNPEQFGPGEDYDKYPRTLQADVEALEGVGADIVYAPSVEEVYPSPPVVHIQPGPAATVLEGYLRPGHFQGVLQVVGKVMNLVQPDTAVFGQKDAQQFVNISQMVRDLDMPVRLIEAPIVRSEGGLALSSRNAYLSRAEAHLARALYRSLRIGAQAARDGNSPWNIVGIVAERLSQDPAIETQYVALADKNTFDVFALWTPDGDDLGVEEYTPVSERTAAYLLVAAKVGPARLIDNVIVEVS